MTPLRKLVHQTFFFVSRTVYMTCCCGCCSALRPRYKRLVDNIFPASPQDGLVKSNMEKLTFYSLSSPEKLDRIGEYLFQKASRDIYRRRHGFVIIAMEAMDQLLLACHSQTLNLFVESFLKMVQKLLESTDPQLQILATQSFVRFANIEEDTPSYHRRYDFFVSKFSAMCHSNHGDQPARDKIRLAGIQGLQGVIRKTVSDDLVENIWEAQHMDKIVPSLLYNMQSGEKYETVSSVSANGSEAGERSPPRLAEACLRELLARASFGHIRSVLRPVLTHFDRHELWIPTDFAVHVFKIIMFSIQAQYSYSAVEALLQHLEAGPESGRVRAARAAVLTHIVAIAAADSVGPSVLEIINNLLTNLRASVARDTEKETDEKLYQEALINALGEFAEHLPDFQKIDIMMFIVNKVPAPAPGPAPAARSKPARADAKLQSILLKSLLKVGSTYKTVELSKAFPGAFLEALLRLAGGGGGGGGEDGGGRLLLQQVLATLLDRHHNRPKLATPTVDYADLDLCIEKCSRQDLIFASKHGYAIFSSLYDGLQLESNSVEHVSAIYTTLALLVVELGSEETVCDILQLILSIQQAGVSSPVLGLGGRCRLQAVAVSLAALVPLVLPLPALRAYVGRVVSARREEAAHLLPPLRPEYPGAVPPAQLPHLMMDQMAVSDCLKAAGLDAGRLQGAAPYAGGGRLQHRHSWLEAGASQGRDSLADIGAPTEVDSGGSSPALARQTQYDDLDEEYRKFIEKYNYNHRPSTQGFGTYHAVAAESISLEALRAAAGAGGGAGAGAGEEARREAERRRHSLNNAFRTAPFAHLVQLTQPKVEAERLEDMLECLTEAPLGGGPLGGGALGGAPGSPHRSFQQAVPPYCKYFPELFLY